MGRDYSMELEFKEPLTEEETSFLKERMLFWGITKKSDGLYHIVWENEYPLYDVMIAIRKQMKQLIYKVKQCIIYGIEDYEDLIEGWKEDGKI